MKGIILISGGTGLVGQALTPLLLQAGYQVRFLSRKKQSLPQVEVFEWDVKKGFIDPKALLGVDYVIHLAGAGVAEEAWTDARKKEIIDSRTQSTELMALYLKKNNHQVKAFISASAIGIYGLDTGENILTENSPYGNDFLAEVTKSWEKSIDLIKEVGIRTVKLRIGIVLSEQGGALAKLEVPVRWGLGAALGSGKQYMSWIHIEDLCRMIMYALENQQVEGVYNAVGKNPVSNAEFTKILAQRLQRPYFLPNVPAFALKMLLGEMAGIVLGGNKVSSQKIESEGFTFKFTELDKALDNLLGK
jgi:uncharacterized protein (TIGR01777 family)